MHILDVTQGSPEWLSIRAHHFTASECSAMLGLSKYQTRNALLQQKATGISPDIDPDTQARFDQGHAAEAAARPLAESIIGQDLYPITATLEVEGLPLLASFDGVSIDEEIIWEHKLFNKALANAVEDAKTGFQNGDPGYSHYIDPHYRFQMDQQLMVSGAKRCLFMTSDGTEDNMSWCWYEPNSDAVDEIVAGWDRFAKDLAAYAPRDIAERPKAEVTIDLPALFVHAKGEITTHNMDEFGLALTNRMAEVRAIVLVTDQDFSNAKEAAKKFRQTAKDIALSKEQMLAQTETIGEAARKMDAWAKDLNATALQLEKDVEREDMAKKTAMVNEAKLAIADHVTALHAEIKPITLNIKVPNFAEALKGKRNYASMQDAVDTALSQAKSEADSVAKDIRAKLAWCKDNADGMSFLFPDLQQIIVKPMDDFTLLITIRIKDHKDAEALKAAEIIAKADAAAAAKLESERAAMQADEERKAREKVAAEQAAERAKVEAEAKAQKALDDLEEETLRKQEAAESKKTPAEEPRPDPVVVGVDLAKSGADQAVRNMSSGKRVQPVPIIIDRPTDAEIIGALAVRFAVSEQTVKSWLADMNLEAAA